MLAHTGIDHLDIGLVGAALIALYGLAWLRSPQRALHSEGHLVAASATSSQMRRFGAWIGGVGTVLVASLPWFEGLAERSFTGHMVQHLLVIVIAAPLLVLAQPVRTVQRAGWIRTTPVGRRFGAAWRHWLPVVGPLLFISVIFGTHLTSVYDRALDNRLLHEVEHAAYLAGAVLTWAAALGVGRASAPARVGAVFGVGAGGALLGMILLSTAEPLVPTYAQRLGTADALSDQRAAAAMMWVGGMLTTVPLLLIAVWRWASTEERVTRQAEALRQSSPTR